MTQKIVALALVVGVVAFLFWPREGDLRHDVPTDVQTCKANLQAIYRELATNARTKKVKLPKDWYAKLAALITKGLWEDTPENRARLSCTGPQAEALDFSSPKDFAPSKTAYACRDQESHPLPKFPAGGSENEPILACDNANGMNHDGVMNVLYTDGSVTTLHLAQEIERGHLSPGTTTITVGVESELQDLKKLR